MAVAGRPGFVGEYTLLNQEQTHTFSDGRALAPRYRHGRPCLPKGGEHAESVEQVISP